MVFTEPQLRADLVPLRKRAGRLSEIVTKCLEGGVTSPSYQRTSELVSEFQQSVEDHYQDSLPHAHLSGEYSKLLDQVSLGNESLAHRFKEVRVGGLRRSSEASSDSAESYRKAKLLDLLQQFFVGDIGANSTNFPVYKEVTGEKINQLRAEFFASRRGLTRAESEEQWRNFKDLMEQAMLLFDYKIMHANSCDLTQLTAKHEAMIESTTKNNSMIANEKFNANPLVGAIDVDPGSQWSSSMGVIQKICYAVFQEMIKPNSGEIDGQHSRSAFTRNDGFGAGKADRIIEMVCNNDQMRLEDGSLVTTNIKQEIDAFPEEVQMILKYLAKCKLTRDDLGSKAGIWHLGKNNGSFKFADGASGRPAGLLATIFYQVGKKNKRNRCAAALGFIDLSHTPFAQDGGDRYKRTTNENVWLIAEDVDHYKQYRYRSNLADEPKYTPELWYQDFPALDELLNQTHESTTGADYKLARDKLLSIIEMATDSIVPGHFSLSDDPQKIGGQVAEYIDKLGSAVAAVWSYTKPMDVNPRYAYVHELMLASFKFFLTNMFNSIPRGISFSDRFLGVFSQHNRKYKELYDIAVSAAVKQVGLNTSLKPAFYSDNLIEFILRRQHRDRGTREDKYRNIYQFWKIKNLPAYEQTRKNPFKIHDLRHSDPLCPVEKGAGWGSPLDKDEGE